MNEGGTASDSCSHVGADGACRLTESAGSISESITTWYYAGQAATEMAQCTSGGVGATWISP